MSVLHTWGSALTHHPHVHMVVPGGGLSRDGSMWIACRPRYFLTVGSLGVVPSAVSGDADRGARRRPTAVLRRSYGARRQGCVRCLSHAPARDRLGGLRQGAVRRARRVLRYLSRYTHRVAISNRRLVSADEKSVTFKYKDYGSRGPHGTRR